MDSRGIRQSIRKHPRVWYYLLLACAVTGLFLGTCALIFAQGRELVWTTDALPLYTSFLVWADQAFWHAIDAMSGGNGFVLPQFTYTMGYGSDVPAAMGSYLQDPINLIFFVLPNEYVGLSYTLMIWLRLVLAAYAFSWYCLARGHSHRVTGIAALAYIACGFVIFLGVFKHAKFMDWAILLPLILLGADRVFNGKRPTLLTVALVLQFCISIYYSYMSCVVLVVYCLIKYFFAPRDRSARDFFVLVLKFAGCGLLAFLVSGLFSLPQIIALLSQHRATSGETTVAILFSLKYYAKVTANLIGGAAAPEGMMIGAASTIGVISFVACRKRFSRSMSTPWLIGLALCFAGVLLPFIGHVMNGMGYSSDRWLLVLAFVCAYVLCMTLPRLTVFDRRDWKRVTIGVVIVATITALYAFAQVATTDGVRGIAWPLCMTAVFLATFAGMRKLASSGNEYRTYVFTGVAIVVCVSLAGIFYCSPLGDNWASGFPKAGGTWKSLTKNTPAAAAEQVDDDGLWRYSVPFVYNSTRNSPLIHNVMGVDYYTSFYNQAVDDFRQELGISDHHMNFSFSGSDSRLAIEDLTGVKYYICKEDDAWRVPYGFVDTGIDYNKYAVYENTNPVPLAFEVASVIPVDEYKQLSMTQKQEALLQGAVVDTSALAEDLPQTDVKLSSQAVDYEVVSTEGVELEGNVAHTYKSDATMTIKFKGLEKSETYLAFENLGFEEYSPSTLAKLSGKDVSLKTRLSDVLWTRSTTYPITATVGDRTKSANPATPEHRRYGGKVDWILNLGYSEEPVTETTIEFSAAGDYAFDSMQVVCQPVEPVVEDARELAAHGLDNLELFTNGMRAQATLDDDRPRIAVFTFAYGPGWSVTVDGSPANVLKTDTAFLGVELNGTGTHTIEWSYEAPGVKAGTAMTLAGLAISLVLIVVSLVRRRRASDKRTL